MDFIGQLKKQAVSDMKVYCKANGIEQDFTQTHTFDYTPNNEPDVELSYSDSDLKLQAELYFMKMVKEDCLTDAISNIAGDDFEDAEVSAAQILLGVQSSYIMDLLLDHPSVIEQAENAAIEIYRGI